MWLAKKKRLHMWYMSGPHTTVPLLQWASWSCQLNLRTNVNLERKKHWIISLVTVYSGSVMVTMKCMLIIFGICFFPLRESESQIGTWMRNKKKNKNWLKAKMNDKHACVVESLRVMSSCLLSKEDTVYWGLVHCLRA